MAEDAVNAMFPVIDPPSRETVNAARRVVCANSVDSLEATELLKMLGLLV